MEQNLARFFIAIQSQPNYLMKRILAILFFAFALTATQFASAQTATKWPEQTTFYNEMQAAYMAWKDNNNISAIRLHADEIYSDAVAWKQAAKKELPKAAKKNMKKLVKYSKQLKALAAKADNDEDVKQKIAYIHSVYTDIAVVAGGPTS